MKKSLIAALLFVLAFQSTIYAQPSETFKKKGYNLTFIETDTTFSKALKAKLVETFFTVYPELAKAYNKKTTKDVTFFIDTAYKGVAATSDARVVFSYKYMMAHPKDIDVVTHEVMHIVQGYGYSAGPVWLTEGIADYVRAKFGVDNAGANWTLPAYKPTQSYTNSYRITARFFIWIEKNVKPDFVKEVDAKLRNHTYTENTWKDETGKTLDELWAAYSANPDLNMA
jgi:hypothetical protein